MRERESEAVFSAAEKKNCANPCFFASSLSHSLAIFADIDHSLVSSPMIREAKCFKVVVVVFFFFTTFD